MTIARQQLISTDVTSYYHCVSRCVRRSFLCGQDPLTNASYEHRRGWIERKIDVLAHIYCIDICAYAIMSNHYHLVVNINKRKALECTLDEIVERWSRIHKLPAIVKRWLSGQLTVRAEKDSCIKLIELWRERLWSLSWFMKELNYHIACKANKEDSCTGHFWESRFKSQALLDEKALAAAMAYVDLNPVRAGTATRPETSEYTSIKTRINALRQSRPTSFCLYPLIGDRGNNQLEGIPFHLIEYIELVDWTSRQLRQGKAHLEGSVPPILSRLDINCECWLKVCKQLEKPRATAVGTRFQALKAKLSLHKQKIQLYSLD
ncbi:transposase [Vibrio sp. WXL103]|uniref:transposase n=1 Tax=Vibrio sp. WXL103 TaxID=3450710 RepID=UPI003EC53585